MKRIQQPLKAHRKEILESWLEQALKVYSKDARNLFATRKNPFTNPVGQRLKEGLDGFIEALADDAPPEGLAECLGEIVQVRAVQDMPPSRALAFVLELKKVVRQALKEELKSPDLAQDLAGLELRVEHAALAAFDLYQHHRERVFQVRINDIKRNVSSLLKRTSFFNSDDNEMYSNLLSNSNVDNETGETKHRNRKRGGGR